MILFRNPKVHASAHQEQQKCKKKKKKHFLMQQRTRLNQSQSMKMPPSLRASMMTNR